MMKRLSICLLSLVLLLSFFKPIVSFAATIGQPLTSPESGWKRFDDKNNTAFYYTGPIVSNYNNAGLYGGTERFINPGSLLKFAFVGTKLRVMVYKNYDHPSNSTVTIDGVVHTISEYAGSANFQSLALDVQGLENKRHEVIYNPVSKYGGIDAIDIDDTGSLVTDTTAPTTPTNVVATPSDGQTLITWSASTDPEDSAINYDVFIDGVKNNSTPISGTSYTVTGISNNQTHSYYVVAYDFYDHMSGPSITVTTFFDTISPLAPVGLAINGKTDALGNLSDIVLTWTANTDPDLAGYNVYRMPATKLNSSLVMNTSFTVTGLAPNTKTSFAVTAVDTSGNESDKSAAVSYTYDLTPPAVPSGVKAAGSNNSVILSWTANNDDAAQYKIYQGGALIGTVNHPTTSYIINGLTNGTAYDFQVSSVDGLGNESAKSAVVQGVPQATPVPTNLSAVPGDTVVTVRWDAMPGVSQYKVYRDGVYIATVNGTSYTDNTVTNGTKYTYQVTSVVDDLESAMSVPAPAQPGKIITIDPPPPGQQSSVMDIVKTALSFASRYGLYIAVVLGIIFAPTILSLVLLPFRKSLPAGQKGKQNKQGKQQRNVLTPEEREKRNRERKLNKARDEKYEQLTRMGRISERDAWVKSVNYLRPEQRQQKGREEGLRKARETRAAAAKSSGGRQQRSSRGGRSVRRGR